MRAQRLIAAAAVLDGRSRARPSDLWVLPIAAPTADTQALAREKLLAALTDPLDRAVRAGVMGNRIVYFGPTARGHGGIVTLWDDYGRLVAGDFVHGRALANLATAT